jgi:hypothetical protein
MLAALENNGEPIKHFTMPLFIGMNVLDGSSCVWDPNLNILFADPDPASENSTNVAAIAGAVGGIFGAVVVGLGIALVASPKFRAKVLPFANRRDKDSSTPLGSELPPVAREATWQPATWRPESGLQNTDPM